MATKNKFSHDYLVLIFNGLSIFLSLILLSLILISLNSQNINTYFVQYRPILGLNSFQTGSSIDIMSFFVFGFVFLAINLLLSYSVYKINRNFSIIIAMMSNLLLILTIFESNSLLYLH